MFYHCIPSVNKNITPFSPLDFSSYLFRKFLFFSAITNNHVMYNHYNYYFSNNSNKCSFTKNFLSFVRESNSINNIINERIII